MALAKTISTQFGVDSTYWNIGSINEDFKNKSIEVVMFGYISQAIRLANAEPVGWQNITLSEDDYVADATRALLYPVLKTKHFIDAQDA